MPFRIFPLEKNPVYFARYPLTQQKEKARVKKSLKLFALQARGEPNFAFCKVDDASLFSMRANNTSFQELLPLELVFASAAVVVILSVHAAAACRALPSTSFVTRVFFFAFGCVCTRAICCPLSILMPLPSSFSFCLLSNGMRQVGK